MIRRLIFATVLAFAGAVLVIGVRVPPTLAWADLSLVLFAASGAAIAGLLLMRHWQRGFGWLVVAAILTTALSGFIGGAMLMTEMAVHAPGHVGIYWLAHLRLLGLATSYPFVLMAETTWSFPVWLVAMIIAAWVARAGMSAD